MIKRENLKKGDMILIVPNSDYTRDESTYTAEVVSIGPKYISVATKWSDGTRFPAEKFNNDERMFEKDYSSRRLFLGTQEEYDVFKNTYKKAKELYYEIEKKFSRNLEYEKLLAIKTIIEADDLYDAICQLYVEQTSK